MGVRGRRRRGPRRQQTGRSARLAWIALLLAFVFALRAVVAEPSVGVSFLALVPILFATYWFGRGGGFLAALAAILLYVVIAAFDRQPELPAAVGLRFAVFCSVALLFAWLLDERTRLSAAVRSRDEELDELRALRAALTPAGVPERPDLELASVFVPAEGPVGGDFYLVAEGPQNATVIVVGDVVGKGMEAARRASFVRAALATFAEFTDDPCRLLEMANAVLIERAGTSSAFVTAACASYRPGDAVVRWSIAGHPPPLRLDEGAPLDGVRPGMPLGLEIELGCAMAEDPLTPGQGVVLFTDGLIEARRRGGEGNGNGMLGVEGVERVLSAERGAPPGRVVEALRAAAVGASDGTLADDLCIVAVRTHA